MSNLPSEEKEIRNVIVKLREKYNRRTFIVSLREFVHLKLIAVEAKDPFDLGAVFFQQKVETFDHNVGNRSVVED
jgi:hypothetical protein